MDWQIFWTACGVIVTLGSMVIVCFRSLSADIRNISNSITQIDQRLSRMEGAFEERGKWESRRKAE